MFYTFGIISYGCVPSKHIIQVPLCHDVRIFLLQCLEDCQAVCVSAHLGGSPRQTSLEGAIDSLCYTPPVMPFWWLRAAFNSSHQWFCKNTLQSLLEVLSVNPWEIPMAPGKKSRVPAGSPGRLHHCCRTMTDPVDIWKPCVRESRPTGYAQAEVPFQCVFYAPSQLLPLWLLSRRGHLPVLTTYFFGLTCSLTLWLVWLSIECVDFHMSASRLKSNCPEKTKTQQNDVQVLNIIHK